MLYSDRKMMKWKGFMLSEHAEQMREIKIEKKTVIFDEQTKELFDRMINVSYHSKLPVVVHLNTFGEPYIQVTGIVQSLHSESGYLHLGGQGVFCLADIVSIDFENNEGGGHGN